MDNFDEWISKWFGSTMMNDWRCEWKDEFGEWLGLVLMKLRVWSLMNENWVISDEWRWMMGFDLKFGMMMSDFWWMNMYDGIRESDGYIYRG